MVQNDGGNGLSSLSRTFAILETIQDLEDASLTKIATELDMPKTTIQPHLQTLRDHGYAIKESENTYQVSLKFLEIGGKLLREKKEFSVAEEFVDKLAIETGERAQFTTPQQGYQYTLYYRFGSNALKADTYVGQRTYLHTNSTGKAMLAHFPEEKISDIVNRIGLPQQTKNTITDEDELMDELAQVRSRGYAVNRGERILKYHAYGVPVFGEEDEVVGGLSVSGPDHRMGEQQNEEEIVDLLTRTANDLQLEILYG